MPIPDSFLTIAELALGLAGFSGVILVFGGLPESMHPVDAARMRLLLSMSLGAMILSVVPFAMQLFAFREPAIWRLSCGLFVGYCLLIGALFASNVSRMASSPRSQLLGGGPGGRRWSAIVGLIAGAAFLAQALHVAGFFPDHGSGIYFLGLLWLIVMAAYLFASLVFIRPRAR